MGALPSRLDARVNAVWWNFIYQRIVLLRSDGQKDTGPEAPSQRESSEAVTRVLRLCLHDRWDKLRQTEILGNIM